MLRSGSSIVSIPQKECRALLRGFESRNCDWQSFHNANTIIKINFMHYQYVRSRDTSFKPLTRSFSGVVLTPELKFEIRTISSYAGEFMNQYSWAEDVTSFLDLKITKG